MRWSDELEAAIGRELTSVPADRLARAAAEISRRYRGDRPGIRLKRDQREAYLAVRAPATYAALAAVFEELGARVAEDSIGSILDLGAGPGTATWAARDAFPSLSAATLVERDPQWIEIGRRIGAAIGDDAIPMEWIAQDLRDPGLDGSERFDLVTVSYALGELGESARSELVARAWSLTTTALCVLEPGTPRGFDAVLRAREALIAAGAVVLAPCPHDSACPLEGKEWCHFAQRLERSAHHRRAKGGRLPFEDEKYSYVAVAREGAPAAARIIRPPARRSGHVHIDLCTAAGGVARRTVTRTERELYRAARKARWGDEWSEADAQN